MADPKVELQANMYLFDLSNSAKEHWFKAAEGWELCIATGEQRSAIERRYHPTLSTAAALPETLLQLYGLVKARMAKPANSIAHYEVPAPGMQYLVAYNPDRLR